MFSILKKTSNHLKIKVKRLMTLDWTFGSPQLYSLKGPPEEAMQNEVTSRL